jgi:lysozyme family protein
LADGVIGPKTMAAINDANPKNLIAKFSDARANFYQGIVARKPDQARFIKGWLNRVEESRKLALEEYDHNDKQT